MLTGPEGGAARALGYRAPPGILVDTRQTWGLQGSYGQPAPYYPPPHGRRGCVVLPCVLAHLLLGPEPLSASMTCRSGEQVANASVRRAQAEKQKEFAASYTGRAVDRCSSREPAERTVGAACRPGEGWCVQP